MEHNEPPQGPPPHPDARNRPAKGERLRRAFLKAYRATGNITAAADACGIDKRRHYEWLDRYDDYVVAFAKAQDRVKMVCEQEALRRAVDGRPRKKFYKGDPLIDPETGSQYIEHEVSDTLLIFMLKSLDPVTYRERYDLAGDVNLNINEQHRKIEESLLVLANGPTEATEQLIDDRINGRMSVNGDIRRDGKHG